MVTLFIAAELFAQKINLEVPFPSVPTLADLTRTTENLYNVEMSHLRPEGHPVYPFRISKFKLYDDVTQRWLDIVSELQLTHNAQLYAFQVENPYHRETQRELPNPTKPRAYLQGVMPLAATQPPHQSPARALIGSAPPTTSMMSGGIASASQQLPMPRADISQHDKFRVVFDDIDNNRDNVIQMEEMRQAFYTLGLQFSSATVSDLFLKGDENRDGIITFPEFERFAQRYPIMLDCMYYHSRMFWDSPALREEIQRAHDAAERARRAVEEARTSHVETQRSLDERSLRLDAMDRDIQDTTRRVSDTQLELENISRERDAVQNDRADRERSLHDLNEQHRAATSTQANARRELDKVAQKTQAHQIEVRRNEERVAQLQQQLAEAQRQLDRSRIAASETDKEAQALKDKDQRAGEQLAEVQRSLGDAESGFRRADEMLRGMLEKERDLDTKVRSMQRSVEELKYQRDNETRAVESMRVQVRQREQQHQDALKSLEDNERRAKDTEQELIELQQQKQRATDAERALVEQEVRLREQRECLEEKESALLRDANVIVSQMKDNSARGTSPTRSSRSTYSYGR